MSIGQTLLLEIGVEELPAGYCAPALEQLRARTLAALDGARLDHGAATTLGTPRRLAVLVTRVATRQEDRHVRVKGPARRAAYDAAGGTTRAAQGFARAQGVDPADLVLETDDKGGEYVYTRRHEAGKSALELLPPLLRGVILGLEFPQTMRWGAGTVRFARPIRWLTCLLGDQEVPVEVGEALAGRTTRGLRSLGGGPVTIAEADGYIAAGRAAGLVIDPVARQQEIWAQVTSAAATVGGVASPDQALLDEVTWLVEAPTALAGSFDPAFLQAPPEALVTSMRVHQRYFPVYSPDGTTLMPHFVAVANGSGDHLEGVRRGNEKVLRARLSDALFFWNEDRRSRLADRREELKGVVFQERLGSQHQRVERIERLTASVAGMLGYAEEDRWTAVRVAGLCKCDLVTALVGEFPELQGAIGRAYARADGEQPAVAEGIYQHYLPRGADDAVPTIPAGVAVALADRLDMLAGYFAIGLIPTGSADPFALRRAAQGVVAIAVSVAAPLSLEALAEAALAGYDSFDDGVRLAARSALREFFRSRMAVLLRDRGLRHDVVDAVLTAGHDDPADTVARAHALGDALDDPQLAAVTAALRRIANIRRKADAGDMAAHDPTSVGREPAEVELEQALISLRPELEGALHQRDYSAFYQVAARLRGPVDAFFDQVLVMDPEPAVRARRLDLLGRIAALITRPADLTRLEGRAGE